MIEYNEKFEKAEKVISLIRKDERMKNVDGEIGTYSNGREQGLHIYVIDPNNHNTRCYAIAEYRQSDDIVVYFSNGRVISDASDVNDEIYKNRVMFEYDNLKECAEYIINDIEFFLL